MTCSVSASGAATVLLSGCCHRGGDDRAIASNSPASEAAEGHSVLPVAGAYGLTKRQAESRLETSGYNNISGLAKDNGGFWRGTAAKNGLPVSVQLFGAQ